MSDNNINHSEENTQNLDSSSKKKSKLNLTYPQPAFAYKGPKFTQEKSVVKSEEVASISQQEIETVQQEVQPKQIQVEEPLETQEKIVSESVEQINEAEKVVVTESDISKMEQKLLFNEISPERVIPVTTNIQEKPKKTSFFAKYKRLLLVLLGLLLLLLLFWALKPNTPKVVEELNQAQSTDLPIEFRPIDAEEAKRAEEAKKALLIEKEKDQQKEQQRVNAILNATDEPQIKVAEAEKNIDDTLVIPDVVTIPNTKNQIEMINKSSAKVDEQEEKVVKKAQKVEKVVPKAQVKLNNKTTTKVLVMKDGVSLMQQFRNHHLKISDVNAMTKAKGASRVFRHLNQGDKVILHLDKNRRVTSMSIKGGRFISQSNGTYIYKK